MRNVSSVALAAMSALLSALLLTGLFSVSPASANDGLGYGDEFEQSEKKSEELEGMYGKNGHFSVPPLVLRPVNSGETHSSVNTTMVDPRKNTPIEISNARFTKRTPAEVFIQAAQIGMYAMAIGAIVLGLVAGSRAIRRR